jgi:predicted nucleic acid-binding Zn ribbon protein
MYDTSEDLPADNSDKVPEGEQISTEEASDKLARWREDKRQTLAHMIWLTVALLVPFLIIFLTSHDDEITTTLYRSFRLGLTSFFVALAILGLSQIDKKILGSRFDAKSQALASCLGVMLWLVWVGSGQMVYKAVDEAKAGSLIDQGSR